MPRGNKKADVAAVFSSRLDELAAKAGKAAAGFIGNGQREWNIPADLDATDLLAIAMLHVPSFDRTAINTQYEECFQDAKNAGTVGDVIALKLQLDYNAAEEQAFRMRHASTVRCLCHAMGRRYGEHVGATFSYIRDTVDEVISAGAVKDET